MTTACAGWKLRTSLEQANVGVRELSVSGYNRFLILDQRTGVKRIVAGSRAAANELFA